MSKSQKPRTPEWFPKMKVRGRKRRMLAPYQRMKRSFRLLSEAISMTSSQLAMMTNMMYSRGVLAADEARRVLGYDDRPRTIEGASISSIAIDETNGMGYIEAVIDPNPLMFHDAEGKPVYRNDLAPFGISYDYWVHETTQKVYTSNGREIDELEIDRVCF